MMDYTFQIKVGKASVSLHFSGGSLTAYGVTPAKYSTSNPVFQHVIERSEPFKNGRIRLLGEMEVADDAAAKSRKAVSAARKSLKPAVVVELSAPEEAESAGKADELSAVESAGGPVRVEVGYRYDAVEYLKEHFPEKGYTSTKLRTGVAFDAACKECGVEFVFTE